MTAIFFVGADGKNSLENMLPVMVPVPNVYLSDAFLYFFSLSPMDPVKNRILSTGMIVVLKAFDVDTIFRADKNDI